MERYLIANPEDAGWIDICRGRESFVDGFPEQVFVLGVISLQVDFKSPHSRHWHGFGYKRQDVPAQYRMSD